MDNSPVSYDEIVKTGVLREAPIIRIAFLDVGQGDTIVISSPETSEAIVVDCIDANAVLEYLEQEETKYLRGIVITHLHDDHYCQVDDLLFRANLVPTAVCQSLELCDRIER